MIGDDFGKTPMGHAQVRAAADSRPRETVTLDLPDLAACPHCGTRDSHWLREVGSKPSWQPFSLTLDGGNIVPDDYREWEVGDDTIVEEFECRHCMSSWPTLEEVRRHLIAAKRARADDEADVIPVSLSYQEVLSALRAIVVDPRLRAAMEGGELLAAARAVLGLTATTTVHVTAPDRVNVVWHHQSAEWEER